MIRYQKNVIIPARMETATYRQSLIAAGGTAPIITSRAIPPELPAAKDKTRTPKQIEPVLHRGRRSAERKDERAAKIEGHQQRVYQDMPVYGHRAYVDSQACAATTSASTPVSNVGWITGAKRGL